MEQKFKLTKNQRLCFNRIDQTNNNIAVLGKPGVGKSVLIQALIDESGKHFHLAAPTGLAALNINGRTLHSIFRPPMSEGIIPPDYDRYMNEFDRQFNNIKYNMHALIIDEISMVRADLFDFIDRQLRHIKDKDVPFGGVQMVIIGDFYQLPPVVRADEKKKLKLAGYESEFVFDSNAFKNGAFDILVLDEVLRQKGDDTFINLLSKARDGVGLLPKDLKPLNENVGHPGDIRTNLCTTNAKADAVNNSKLTAIDGDEILFTASKFGEWPTFPTEEILKLKIGAQVMVKQNKADVPPNGKKEDYELSKVVNGTLGIVTDIVSEEPEGHSGKFFPYVEIETNSGDRCKIYRRSWERSIKSKNENGKWEEKVIASFEQMPLMLAWAISMHKSQGMTLERVHIDFGGIFAPGQAYVALSRCKSISGVSLQVPAQTRHFYANEAVSDFYEKLEMAKI